MIDLSSKPYITGENVILRPFQDKDLPFIEECLRDPEVIKLTGSTDDYDEEVVVKWYKTRNDQNDRLDLAIVDKDLDVLVGEVVANLYQEEKQSMNFRILIGPRGRDRGFGTEATGLFIDHLFEKTKLNQLTLSVFDFNPRAKKVYEKVGFTVESVDKQELEYDGEWIDSINMVLTRASWLKGREGE
ncbi:MAG: GNAT family N-acetyltransferase [Bacillota bacterium]